MVSLEIYVLSLKQPTKLDGDSCYYPYCLTKESAQRVRVVRARLPGQSVMALHSDLLAFFAQTSDILMESPFRTHAIWVSKQPLHTCPGSSVSRGDWAPISSGLVPSWLVTH